MKIYPKDIIYQQGEFAEEIFFIVKGRVKMLHDISESHEQEPINIPFNLYIEGSYFGDVDIFQGKGRNIRDSTAMAAVSTQLFVISRKEIIEICKRFRRVNSEMQEVANERRKYHMRGIKQARANYHEKAKN